MQLNRETFIRETHKVSLTIDGQEHLLLQGTEACNEFFDQGKILKLNNEEKGWNLELGWTQGIGQEPSISQKYGRGIRHGQYWLKLDG